MKFELRLSPHLTQQEKAQLTELSQHFPQKDHMWMASSGSSQGSGDSVKLIALSQRALVASAVSVNHHLQAGPGDRWFQALPTFHVGGLGVELRAELLGLPVFPMPSKWQPQGFTQACQDSGATLGSLVPTQIFDLVREGQRAPPQLRAVIVGGGALQPELYLEARELGWPLLPSFGMTEACSQIATASLSSLSEKFSEKKFPDLQILEHLQARVRSGEEPLLEIKGESLLTGYAQWKNGEATWVSPLDSEGWLVSEDLAEVQGRRLRPLGRRGDYFKILGEGVSRTRLQQILEQVLAAQEFSPQVAAVVILQEQRRGAQVVLAFERSLSRQEVEKILRDYNLRVLSFEKISTVVEVERIPRTELHKLRLAELQEMIQKKM